MTQETVMIENKTGIHARPASVFVQTATKFKSKIQIEAKGKKVDAKSILMLMSMGLVKGTELTIIAEGEDEAAAVKELADLVKSKFGEEQSNHYGTPRGFAVHCSASRRFFIEVRKGV